MTNMENRNTRSAEAAPEQGIRRGTRLWGLVFALVLLYWLAAVVGDLVALLGLISTAAVCWAYERSAGKERHQAATALLFALGANLALAIANLMLLRLARGSAVRPLGLAMANVVVPVVSGVIGTVLSIRGAVVDHGLWRLLSAPGLLLSLMAFETGQLCFAAAVHLRGLVLKP